MGRLANVRIRSVGGASTIRAIDDRLVLGTVAGTLGAATSAVVTYTLFKLGATDATLPQRATGLVVPDEFHVIRGTRWLGLVASLVVGGAMGVGQTYLYSVTGRDKRHAKAVTYGLLSWVGVHGLGSRAAKSFDVPPRTATIALGIHLMNALITSEAIVRLGDNGLFVGPRGLMSPPNESQDAEHTHDQPSSPLEPHVDSQG